MLCETAAAILSGVTTSDYIYKPPGRVHEMFGDKAEGQERIDIQGEKEAEAHVRIRAGGVPLNGKTYEEMQMIAAFTGAQAHLPKYLDV